MLQLTSAHHSQRFCDGQSRRSFLRIGGIGGLGALGSLMSGLSLSQVLKAEGTATAKRSNKSLIIVYLPGGPPHQDLFDLKMDAPSEIRGEFRPISTNVPGIQICEHLPLMAKMADKFTFIRSVVGAKDRHESFQCMTGRLNDNQPPGGWPEIGSVVSKLQGSTGGAVPPYVNLSPKMQHTPYNFGRNSFLGVAHSPFTPMGSVKDDMTLNGITLERLQDRRALLHAFDTFRRDADASGMIAGMDEFDAQAFDILTSSRLLKALDVSSETQKIRERYGKGTDKTQGDAAPRLNQQFLLARRLVEAGVRVVTLSYSFWDWHGKNFDNARQNFPDFDQALTALVQDLHDRGMDKEVTVIAFGEFGRTPKINSGGGRDHWPNVSCALLAGGGMKTGQIIGATDRYGGEATERPVHFQELFATLYQNLGLNATSVTVPDLTGRPQFLVDGNYQPIKEVIA